MKCFYHKADLDGICAGAIVKHKYPTVELIGADYGDSVDWATLQRGEKIYIVDFSFSMPEMKALNEFCQLYWIDHHATAIDEARRQGIDSRTGEFVLASGTSGCELTWAHLFPGVQMPRAVSLLGRYDVWDHAALPGIVEFQQGMKLIDLDAYSDEWTQLLSEPDPAVIDMLISDGQVIRAYQVVSNRIYAETVGHVIQWHGMTFIAINKCLANSMSFDGVYDPEKHDAMMAFGWNGKQWRVSIYSNKPEVNAGEVCKIYGGGGHKGAAGFICARLPFWEVQS
jgi:oligoribonuclease NrnB/cAMP/cGMP phosphodiesterase (DHH superfamily)